jgi:hypothetical protein
MKIQSFAAVLMSANVLIAVPALAQTTPSTREAAQKQRTDGEGPPMVGPASGAYKEYSDPKGWDASAEAWHKQHTEGVPASTTPPQYGSDSSDAQRQSTQSFAHSAPPVATGEAVKQQ